VAAKAVRTIFRILHQTGNYVKIVAEPHCSKPQKNPEKNTRIAEALAKRLSAVALAKEETIF